MSSHIHLLNDIQLSTPSIVTIGVFDGVHVGHQKLVRRLVEEARLAGLTSVVLTFFPHPDVVLRGVQGRYYLTSPEERADLLLGMGVDRVITHTFNREISRIPAAEFVARLVEQLKMTALWVGADFALGYRREGNVDFLRAQGQLYGFTVDTVGLKLGVQNEVISSSRIREALAAGDVEQVGQWLGRLYRLKGPVIEGDHRGRTLGFATANIEPWAEQLLPANGVYACWVYAGRDRFMAVTNIGVQPTFDASQLKVEAYLLDFAGDLYGQDVRLDFVRRLRAEKRFASVDDLVAQIRQDVSESRALLTALAEREQV